MRNGVAATPLMSAYLVIASATRLIAYDLEDGEERIFLLHCQITSKSHPRLCSQLYVWLAATCLTGCKMISRISIR